MRKMTKTAVTLAAMSAMTVASASMALAATKQEPNISSISEAQEVVNTEASGKWGGSDISGWTFTKENGEKLKNQWAEIDGIWYYFEGETILQDSVKYIDGETYFFNENGTLATGWQRITSKMDAYGDIQIPEVLRFYDDANDYVDINDAYDYEDYVWCYFDEHGAAKENEWFQSPVSGLWYYFDGNVMVKNIYNYEIEPYNYDASKSDHLYLYGFDKEGAMLTGWNYKEGSTTWNTPTADAKGKTWYYYTSSGKMQESGWKQLDGNWFLFADYERSITADTAKKRGYPLIVNSFVASFPKVSSAGTEPEYFYVDKDGKMQTGVTTIPKKAWKVLFYPEIGKDYLDVKFENIQTADEEITVYLGTKGAATEKVINMRYYTLGTSNTVKATLGTDIQKLNNTVYNAESLFPTSSSDRNTDNVLISLSSVTDKPWEWTDKGESTGAVSGYFSDIYAVSGVDFAVKGEVVKNAFIARKAHELYLADDKGDLFANKAVIVNTSANISYNGETYNNAYILFGRDGKALTNYNNYNKSVTIGGVTYWATNVTVTVTTETKAKVDDVTIFISNKVIDPTGGQSPQR